MRKPLLLLTIFLFGCCLSAYAQNSSQPRAGAIIFGRVTNFDSKRKISDAKVKFTSENNISNTYLVNKKTGLYSVNLAGGVYKVVISAPGFVDLVIERYNVPYYGSQRLYIKLRSEASVLNDH